MIETHMDDKQMIINKNCQIHNLIRENNNLVIWIFAPYDYLYGDKSVCQLFEKIKSKNDVIAVKECFMNSQAMILLMSQLEDKSLSALKGEGLYTFILAEKNSIDEFLVKNENQTSHGLFLVIKNCRDIKTVTEAIFNLNTLHFLNKGNPYKYERSIRMLKEFEDLLLDSNLNPDDFVIDTGMVMSLYGVRETGDLDFYCKEGIDTSSLSGYDMFEEHDNKQNSFYSVPTQSLISNPAYHFTFHGMKFVALEQLLTMKKNRIVSDKDIKDIKDIKNLLNVSVPIWQDKIDNCILFCRWNLKVIIGMFKNVLRNCIM